MTQRKNPLLHRQHPSTIGLHRLPIHRGDRDEKPPVARKRRRCGKYKIIPIDQLAVDDSVVFPTLPENHDLHSHTLRGWAVHWEDALGITISVHAVPGGYRLTRTA